MRAFMVEKYGEQTGMRAAEIPAPQAGADDVLVKIHAAGVNPLDLRIRNGDFKAFMPYRLPLVLGNDLAGTVVRVGPSVTRFAVGDEVYSRPDKDRIGTKPGRPWRTLSQVELATAEWVDWYCHRRLHGEMGHIPPVEYEANHYRETTKHQVTTTN